MKIRIEEKNPQTEYTLKYEVYFVKLHHSFVCMGVGVCVCVMCLYVLLLELMVPLAKNLKNCVHLLS